VGDLSPHFDTSEFRDHSTGELVGPPAELIAALENLRGQTGNRPCVIVSGYRTPAHNAEIGGASDSRHIHGDAADLEEGYATQEMAQAAGFVGIGVRNGWAVHVDMRPGEPVVFDD
jgi:uncharacterized protein YcbK (DUF882 family)